MVDLEKQLGEQAETIGVSVAKLRVIYSRGVAECLSNGYTEPPVFHGLARVQRYVFAHQSGNSRLTVDDDLLPKDYSSLPESKVTPISTQGEWPMVYNLINSQMLDLFPGEVVAGTTYDIDEKTLNVWGDDWSFTYNFSDGTSALIN